MRQRHEPKWRCSASKMAIGALMLFLVPNCKAEPPQAEAVNASPQKSPAASQQPSEPGVSRHGSAIVPGNEAKLSNVLSEPRKYEGRTVTVEGEVRRVCKKMGCWMELATAKQATAPGCRVFFGAHQFFVPKDSDGARARVQGEVQLKKVDASFVQHLEEEGASFKAKNADGTADEVRLVATGVELKRI